MKKTDPCIGCPHNPKPNALRCTGGHNGVYRDDPATSRGWANPIRAQTEGRCPFLGVVNRQ